MSHKTTKNISRYVIKITGGYMRGTEIPIKKKTFILGRSKDADGVFKDTLMSRKHSRLVKKDDNWYLEDLKSMNGTWLAGQKLTGQVKLPFKTPVKVGNTIFELYNLASSEGQETSLKKHGVTVHKLKPNTFVSSHLEEDKDDPVSRIAKSDNKSLSSVYKFQHTIASITDISELYRKTLSAVTEIIPADKAFLLLFDLSRGEFYPAEGRTSVKRMKKIEESDLDREIITYVRENKEAILMVDDYKDKKISEISDLAGMKRSVMCIPILGKGHINGMLYVMQTSSKEVYNDEDLSLLMVLGHTVGMAIENCKMMEESHHNEQVIARGTIAADISHYIKNILAGLDGSLSMLRIAIDEKDFMLANESWEILSRNHRRLGNLALDLLNLASEQKLKLEVQDLNIVIQEVVELMEGQLAKEGIEIIHDPTTKAEPHYAEIDIKGIHRVLLNLISNAEHAILVKQKKLNTNEGIIGSILISANLNKSNNYITLRVEDDGIGLDKDEIDNIFNFHVSSKGSVGTGIGLTVSKRIIESHGGSISVEGKKNEGCVFYFTAPVAQNLSNTDTTTLGVMS